jgi:hypothetical protein
MAMRAAATHMHNHDRLMSIAFDGIGSLPMATIDKFRDLKVRGGTLTEQKERLCFPAKGRMWKQKWDERPGRLMLVDRHHM